ncbi:type II secretion system protein [Roseateles flavus]|uniref:Type II secretion system protein n=1 Tax=Roseateles flavus TaxID=3149041 RepID=A0ABV0GKK6_9BURK
MARGFSLIELLVVVAIMAVLASIGFPLAELAHRRSQEEELRRSLREIRTALDAYKRASDAGLVARPVGGSGYPPSLQVLVEGAVNAQMPMAGKLVFLRRLPRDPMASAAVVDAADTWALRSYDSAFNDPKPGRDVFDVHSKAEGSGLDGRPYRDW